MQEVSEKWIATNQSAFTVPSFITIMIHRNSGTGTLFIPTGRIMAYTQSFYGDMLAGEIPEMSVVAKLNNNDGIYTSSLSADKEDFEHAAADILISFNFNSVDPEEENESINGGRFFVSEITYDANDRSLTLRLSDILQFMNSQYNGRSRGWVEDVVNDIIVQAKSDNSVPVQAIQCEIDSTLTGNVQVDMAEKFTLAEALQVCANASNCVLFVDRDSVIHIEPINREVQDYFIGRNIQYTETNLTKDKAINSVLVNFLNYSYDYTRKTQIGSQQTVTNPAIMLIINAMNVARRTYRTLQENREVISGEFRCDPRVDIFDVIQIESSKRNLRIYDLEQMPIEDIELLTINEIENSTTDIGIYCITSLEMTFTGAWHGKFSARAINTQGSESLRTWGNLKLMTWGQARDYSWDEVRGGYYV